MSKIFYDHLIKFEEVEIRLSACELSHGEKEEIHQAIDEAIHYRVMTRILDHLPREHHNLFLEYFHRAPHSEKLLHFLKEKVENIEDLIREEIIDFEKLLLSDLEQGKIPHFVVK